MTIQRITVLLADDHAVVRTGYRRLLELTKNIQVVAEADTAEECYRLYLDYRPMVTISAPPFTASAGFTWTKPIVRGALPTKP